MYKIYFKQAVEMLKQNKFFSIISILGTALAIMMIMSIIISDEVKNISIAPENNRDRTLYLTYQSLTDSLGGGNYSKSTGSISYEIIKNYISLLQTPELISVQTGLNALVSREASTENISTNAKCTDPAYWKLYSFSFLKGKPFGEEEFQSGLCEAVISESMAKKLFKGENALEQTIKINFRPYKVIGIVKDVSPVFTKASSEIWIPYTSRKNPENAGYHVMLLAKNKNDYAAIREEIKKIERKFKEDEITKTVEIRWPETHRVLRMNIRGNNEKEMKEKAEIRNRKIAFILIIIMLVPAINLSGLNLSRIKRRTQEIGVRKAFGAKKHIILIQILWENLIVSFIGGIFGMAFSVLVIFLMKDWLLGIPQEGGIPFSTIISIPVFLSVFAACVIINILSAAIPAYRASRMTIVHSLTNNDK
ncbi:MAG: ABC transporter permease [Tannerella sp.]|jgi:putative ABC transport system permease protein|nr:ABC transporter permease [Tannerella sp.]